MINPSRLWSPWSRGSRIKGVVGHYGSGKTEIALNLALARRAAGVATVIVDMDIVNPFFRSAEQGQLLEAHDVELISPPYALTGIDLPVLPAEILKIFARDDLSVVLDVGGEDAGAAALGRFKPNFDRQSADLYYVVNLYRPFSETAEQIIDLMRRIEQRGRLRPVGLINNSNLGGFTDVQSILKGQEVLERVAREAGIPIAAIAGLEEVLQQLPEMDVPLLPIKRLMKPEWMEN